MKAPGTVLVVGATSDIGRAAALRPPPRPRRLRPAARGVAETRSVKAPGTVLVVGATPDIGRVVGRRLARNGCALQLAESRRLGP